MAGVSVGVFGGTFDPVHAGHRTFAEKAREQLGLGRVLWTPAGDPWRKGDRKATGAAKRVEMVRLAIGDTPAFELCTIEIERPGPTYTVETLAELRQRYEDAQLYFLLGLDALLDLPNWREPAKIIELALLAVAARGGQELTPDELDRVLAGLGKRVVWIGMPTMDVSGTEIRRRAAAGQSLQGTVPEAVEAYIREHRLYK